MGKAKTPKKTGRPSSYKPEYCKLVIEHLEQGYSLESFGPKVSVHRDTIYAWRENHEEFSDAIKKGIDAGLFWWEQMGRGGMLGKVKLNGIDVGVPHFNAAVWIFTMKNRFKWTDVTVQKVEDNRVSEAQELMDELKKVVARKQGIK